MDLEKTITNNRLAALEQFEETLKKGVVPGITIALNTFDNALMSLHERLIEVENKLGVQTRYSARTDQDSLSGGSSRDSGTQTRETLCGNLGVAPGPDASNSEDRSEEMLYRERIQNSTT